MLNTSRLLARSSRLLARPGSVASGRRSFFRIIRQGQVGMRLFLGKNPTQLDAGIRVVLPIVHSLKRVDLREGGIDVGKLNACTKDNVPVVVSGTMFYRITDPFEACFKVQDVLTAVTNLGTSAMRSVMGTLHYDDIIADRSKINSILTTHIGDSTKAWGISCTKFEIQQFEPQNSEIKRYLEMQMEAERRRRQQELDTKAAVNVADGKRQSAVLESLGDLEAKKNQADAQRYSIEVKAHALASELKAIVEAIGCTESEARGYILETKRLDHLAALAANNSAKTYFMPSDSVFPTAKMVGDLLSATKK
jgi:regulator of protease activity HflC (stomatin/prohibitin superfamily)